MAMVLPLAAFDLQGHRGSRGHRPENTLAAFEHALAIGVTTLELDIAFTADGAAVISHDQALNPDITRDANGQWLAGPGPLIHSLALAQVQSHDVGRLKPGTRYARQFPLQRPQDGQRIPTLAQLFMRVQELRADQVRFNLETKIDPSQPANTLAPEPFARALLAVIREHGMEQRVTIQSFDWRPLQVISQLAPAIPTAYLTSERNPNSDTTRTQGQWTAGFLLRDHGSTARTVKAAGGTIWSPHFNDLTPALLQEARELGLKVIPWTVNEAPDIERIIAMGVDGIISDYPDRVRELMRKRGMALPPSQR